MPRNFRYDKILQRTTRGVMRRRQAGGFSLWKISPLYLLGAVIFTLICLIPLAWRIEPLPFYLGYVANADVRARLEFAFESPDEESLIAQVEANHFPMYEEKPQSHWMREVFSPIASLIESAADLRDPQALEAYAQKESIALTPEQASVLTDFLLKEQNSNLYSDILEPMRRILETWIYPRGVITDAQYQLETESGRATIEVIGGGSRVLQGRLVPLVPAGQPAPVDAPVDVTQARQLLEKGFYDELWLIKRSVRQVLADLLIQRIENHPTLAYDEELTKETLDSRRRQHLEAARRIVAGELLLKRGVGATPADLNKLRAEEKAFRLQQGFSMIFFRFLGKAFLLLLIAGSFVGVYQQLAGISTAARRTAFGIGAFCLLLVAGAHASIYLGIPGTLLPVGLVVAMATFIRGRGVGILVATALSFFLFVLYEGQIDVIASYLAGGWIMAALLPAARFRQQVFSAANICGLFAGCVILAVGWSEGEMPELNIDRLRLLDLGFSGNLWVRAIWTYGAWLATSILLLLALPMISKIFRVTTQLQLQDLQDQEHPCLRQLLIEAPSTYHHSLLTGTLAESAAAAIGANSLLCKVASYYHDIGKLIKPEYFTENESGISRHDTLSPYMSKLIIISHVKDGVEMALAYGLPRPVIDMIEQHHGTTQVSYFLHRAQALAEDAEDIDGASFRYPGPRPQSVEAAIIMICDSVEAASRSLEHAAPEQIRKLAHGIIMTKLHDRQFDECPLTLADLDTIEDTIVHLLASMLHSRIKYPGSQEKEEKPSRRS